MAQAQTPTPGQDDVVSQEVARKIKALQNGTLDFKGLQETGESGSIITFATKEEALNYLKNQLGLNGEELKILSDNITKTQKSLDLDPNKQKTVLNKSPGSFSSVPTADPQEILRRVARNPVNTSDLSTNSQSVVGIPQYVQKPVEQVRTPRILESGDTGSINSSEEKAQQNTGLLNLDASTVSAEDALLDTQPGQENNDLTASGNQLSESAAQRLAQQKADKNKQEIEQVNAQSQQNDQQKQGPAQDPEKSSQLQQSNPLTTPSIGAISQEAQQPQENQTLEEKKQTSAQPQQTVQNQANQLAAQAVKKSKEAFFKVLFRMFGGVGGWLAGLLGGSSIATTALVISLILALVLGVYGLSRNLQEGGGGGDELLFYGKSSPETCTRSTIEAGFGLAARRAGITNDLDPFGLNLNTGTQTSAYLQAQNDYAKYAALTAELTSYLIRSGKLTSTAMDRPDLDKENPYGSGIVIKPENAQLVAKYLNTPLNTEQNRQAPTVINANLTNYDATQVSTRIEGASARLAPDPLYVYTPNSVRINYFDVQSRQTLSSGRVVDAGVIQQSGVSAEATRKAAFHESYGVTTDSFAAPQTPPPALPPQIPLDVGPNAGANTPSTSTTASIPLSAPDGTSDQRLTDNTMVSFYSLTLGLAMTVTFATKRIPFVSDFVEWLLGKVLQFLKLEPVKIPVFSSTYYQVGNIGSFAGNLLNNFDAFLNKPFAGYTGHTVLKDQSQAVDEGFNTFIRPGVETAGRGSLPTFEQWQSTNPGGTRVQYDEFIKNEYKKTNPGVEANIPLDANGNPIANPAQTNELGASNEERLANDPQIQRYKGTVDALSATQSGVTTSPTPEFVAAWQDKDSVYALRDALESVTNSLLRAGNTPRTVSGLNVRILLNIAVDITPAPPFLLILPGLPTIDGAFATKFVSNAPSGQEFLDLYNRVGIAVLKASSDPAWDATGSGSFVRGVLADGNGVAKEMEEWIGECKTGRYDTTAVGGGTSSAFTQAFGLNSCKIYDKNAANSAYGPFDRYLPRVVDARGERSNAYITPQARAQFENAIKNSGWLTTAERNDPNYNYRRAYYESIIASEARLQGIDPMSEFRSEDNRVKLAYILATAGFETNYDINPKKRQFQDQDFVRFSEINPLSFPTLQDLVGTISEGDGDFLSRVGTAINDLIDPIVREINAAYNQEAPTTSANTAALTNREADFLILFLSALAGINEAYGPLGKQVTEGAMAVLTDLVNRLKSLIPFGIGDAVVIDLKTFLKKWYNYAETGDFGKVFFNSNSIDHVFDSDENGAMYYGRGFALSATRGRGIYKQLEKQLNKPFVTNVAERKAGNPNLLRQDPSTMAQALIAGMKAGVFTGYRLDDFFNERLADPKNARKIIDANFVPIGTITLQDPNFIERDAVQFTTVNPRTGTLSPSEAPNRNPEFTTPDKLLLERYRYYYTKLGAMNEEFYKAAQSACNSPDDGTIFKDNVAAGACLKEGFNYVNTSDEKNRYQTYGFTIKANALTPIYPLFPGKILVSNFATRSQQTSDNQKSVSEEDIIARRQRGDPVAGNQVSIVSSSEKGQFVVRYTNLDGRRLPPKGILPNTSINKDDVIGYVGNSGPARDGKLPDTQVRVEIMQYFGADLAQTPDEILKDAKTWGNLVNPVNFMNTELTSTDPKTLKLCNRDAKETNLYSSGNFFTDIPDQGIVVPGSGNYPIDPWLLLR